MIGRASVTELFDAAELLTLMRFDLNAPVGGLVDFCGDSYPQWTTSFAPTVGQGLTWEKIEAFKKKLLDG